MPEENVVVKDKAQDTPSPQERQSSEKPERTHTQAEFEEKVLTVHAENGRLKKELEKINKERDVFKSQAEQLKKEVDIATSSLKETESRIADLESDLAQAIQGDADLTEIKTIKDKLRSAESQLKKDIKEKQEAIDTVKKALTSEREQWAETVDKAKETNFEMDIWEVSGEFEDGDAEKLMAICNKFGIKNRGESQETAELIWHKKAKEPSGQEVVIEGKGVVLDSGVTSGGGMKLGNMTPREKIEMGIKQAQKKR